MPRIKLVWADRFDALTPRQRVGQLKYGNGSWARWERTPDVVARWCMFDRNLSVASATALARIVAAAYGEMVEPLATRRKAV